MDIKPKISKECRKASIEGDTLASFIIDEILHAREQNRDFIFSFSDPDTGSDNMNFQLQKYYKYRYFETENDKFDYNEFCEEASKFLMQNDYNYNTFFLNLSPIFDIDNSQILDEKTILFSLKVVKDLEDKNKPIHKGTPYHMLGITYINDGNLLKGFLHVHQADMEDERINHKEGAAYPFITLNSKEAKAGKKIIERMEKFIDDKSERYQKSGRGKLELEDFRSKFLKRDDIRETVFQFVYSIFRLKEIEDFDKKLKQNNFMALYEKDIIFDFCTIIENIIKKQNRYSNESPAGFTLYPLLAFLSDKCELILHEQNELYIYNRDKNKNFTNLKWINSLSQDDFSNVLKRLLNSDYFNSSYKKWNDFSSGFVNHKDIDEDLLIAYILRNSVHNIKSWDIIYKNFDKIMDRILYSLFYSVENLCI